MTEPYIFCIRFDIIINGSNVGIIMLNHNNNPLVAPFKEIFAFITRTTIIKIRR